MLSLSLRRIFSSAAAAPAAAARAVKNAPAAALSKSAPSGRASAAAAVARVAVANSGMNAVKGAVSSSSSSAPSAPRTFVSLLAELEKLSTVKRTVSSRPALLEEVLLAAPDGDAKSLAAALQAGVVGAAMEPTVRTTSFVIKKLLAGSSSESSLARIDEALALLGNAALRLPASGSAFANLINAARTATVDAAVAGTLAGVMRRIAIVARARHVEASGIYVTAGVSGAVSARDWPLALRFLKDGMQAAKRVGGSGAAGSSGLRRAAFKLMAAMTIDIGASAAGSLVALSPAQLKWCAETLPILAGAPFTPSIQAMISSAPPGAAVEPVVSPIAAEAVAA